MSLKSIGMEHKDVLERTVVAVLMEPEKDPILVAIASSPRPDGHTIVVPLIGGTAISTHVNSLRLATMEEIEAYQQTKPSPPKPTGSGPGKWSGGSGDAKD